MGGMGLTCAIVAATALVRWQLLHSEKRMGLLMPMSLHSSAEK